MKHKLISIDGKIFRYNGPADEYPKPAELGSSVEMVIDRRKQAEYFERECSPEDDQDAAINLILDTFPEQYADSRNITDRVLYPINRGTA